MENTSENIFLTGKAGTGKTTFLKQIVQECPKRKIVVAPTGVAAINAEGVTVHSFFQIPFGICLPDYNLLDKQDRKDRFNKLNKTKTAIIRSLELLIIDEVSMLRADVLDAIDGILRRYRRNPRPFGGVQVLMIGDMQQLPPVTKGDEWSILREYYRSPFFFDSKVLTTSGYVCIELQKIYRQSDMEFIDLLAKVRENRLDSAGLDKLNSRYREGFEPRKEEGYIILTTHNDSANIINDREMNKLETPTFSFDADIQGEFPSNLYPQSSTLTLKEGAQVMFTKNDHTQEHRYVNGTLGVVTAISDDYIEVTPLGTAGSIAAGGNSAADGDFAAGEDLPSDESFAAGEDLTGSGTEPIEVERDQWENLKYEIDPQSKEIVSSIAGMFTQYPLRPAWAITIHKSQGLTFDRAIIDAAKSFTHGQVYVALSRCRTLEGMVLSSRISPRAVMNDEQICAFNKRSAELEPTPEQLALDKQKYVREVLTDEFDFSYITKQVFWFSKFARENLESVYPKLIENWENKKNTVRAEIEDVGLKFAKSLERLVGPDYETSTYLRERLSKASAYFIDRCAELLIPLVSATSTLEPDSKEAAKTFNEIIGNLTEALRVKTALFRYTLEEFDMQKFLKIKAEAVLEASEGGRKAKKRAGLPRTGAESAASDRTAYGSSDEDTLSPAEIEDIQNSELFLKLRNWRYERSRDLNLPAYCIMHQKTLIEICNTRPTTEKELIAIKGIGKTFVGKYGQEVLEIVAGMHES